MLPVIHGYVTWCHSCSWNIVAPARDEFAGGRLGRAYAAAGRRLGSRLARQLIESEHLEPRVTPAKILAFAIALAFFAAVLAAAGLGIFWIAASPTSPAAVLIGALLVAIAILVRPRFGSVARQGAVSREEAPQLYALADAVASALDAHPVDVIVVTHEFNASFAVVGLRRRHVLTLGLPLLAALDAQEVVALVAHELAHGRNGDSTRGLVVGSALEGLVEVYGVLTPRGGDADFDQLAFFGWIANALMWVLSRPFWWLFLIEFHLLRRDSQRAEYLADALAARAAGTQSVVSLHEKLLLESSFDGLVREYVHGRSEGDLFAEVKTRLAAVPSRERERRRRVARLEESRLEDTHPPTALRIQLLEDRPRLEANVALSAFNADLIDRELTPMRRAVQARLVDFYRDSLYA
jgi:Zn-dependent protease with chaperone function